MSITLLWQHKPHHHIGIAVLLRSRHAVRGLDERVIGNMLLPQHDAEALHYWWQCEDGLAGTLRCDSRWRDERPDAIPNGRRPVVGDAWRMTAHAKHRQSTELRIYRPRPDGSWDRKGTLNCPISVSAKLLVHLTDQARGIGLAFELDATSDGNLRRALHIPVGAIGGPRRRRPHVRPIPDESLHGWDAVSAAAVARLRRADARHAETTTNAH